jgi:heptosyltransferase-2
MIRVPNWVGDVVLSLPALQALRRAFPAAELTAVAKPWVADVLEVTGVVDDMLLYRPRSGWQRVIDFLAVSRELRGRSFSAAFLFQNAFEAAAMAVAAGVPVRVGRVADGRRLLLTHPVSPPDDPDRHQSEGYLDLVRAVAEVDAVEFRPVSVSAAAVAAARERLNSAGAQGSPLVVVAPGARYGSAKRWPPDRFARVADGLIEVSGAIVVLLGSEVDRPVVSSVAANMSRRALDLCGKLSLAEAIGVISLADVVVSNDSGAMHLAAMCGTPVVAIFGPTNPSATGPMGPGHVVLHEPPGCYPCDHAVCPTDHRCMLAVSPARVQAAVESLLARAATEGGSAR